MMHFRGKLLVKTTIRIVMTMSSPGKKIAILHLIIGLSLFVIFLITGKYMRVDFPDKEIIPQDLRLLMRSRHIYILFSALIHLALGVYLQIRPLAWQKA